MSLFFWESTQRAKRPHFCDWCFNWIQPGEVYKREAWVPQKGVFRIMKQHSNPDCPRGILEELAADLEAERAHLGVPIGLVLENRLVQKILMDGTVAIETEVVPTLKELTPAPQPMRFIGSSDDTDVPF